MIKATYIKTQGIKTVAKEVKTFKTEKTFYKGNVEMKQKGYKLSRIDNI